MNHCKAVRKNNQKRHAGIFEDISQQHKKSGKEQALRQNLKKNDLHRREPNGMK
jgi:hypothetical protein